MSVTSKLILILLCASICCSCNARYGYLSKVRVGKVPKQETKNKIAEQHVITNESSESDKNVIASNDSLPDLNSFRSTLIPRVKLFPPFQHQIKADKSDNKQAKKKTVDSSIPINIFAKWSLILGIVGLFSYPLVIPCIIGPILIYASTKALKQIKLSRERGKGMAVFGLIIGILTSILLIFSLAAIIIEIGFLYGLLFFLAFALVSLILFIILKSRKSTSELNAIKEKERNRKGPVDKATRHFIAFAIIFAMLTLSYGYFIFGGGFGPITFMFARRAINYIPEKRKILKIITLISLIIGILGTIEIFVAFVLLFPPTSLLTAILLTLTLFFGILFTLLGAYVLSVTPKPGM